MEIKLIVDRQTTFNKSDLVLDKYGYLALVFLKMLGLYLSTLIIGHKSFVSSLVLVFVRAILSWCP